MGDSLAASLEAEQRAKGEALRIKKKLEGEINELEIGLDHANKANSEGLKSVKRYQTQLRETIQVFEDESRGKRQIEAEIADARAAVNEIQSINARDMTAKRSLEGSIHTLQAEIDAMLGAAKNAEEKSKKAMVDAARLADELRAEQDHATSLASSKNAMNNQFGDLEARYGEAFKAYQRSERKVKELQFSQSEDKKNQDRMSELATKLQQKIK